MQPKFPKFPRVMLALGGVATVLPIFCGYFCSFWLLCWLGLKGPWRPDNRDSDDYTQALRPLGLGVLAMAGGQFLANIGSAYTSPFALPLQKILSTEVHMVLKIALLWFVIMAAHGAARRAKWFLIRDAAPWLLAWFSVHLVYCLVQRQTGIDWVHGLSAHLNSDRFAYGVYRVNGFSGHPLSLAYNLTLLVVVSAWLVLRRRQWLATAFGIRTVYLWTGILGVTLLTLMISGSRYPFAAVFLVLAVTNFRQIWRKKAVVSVLLVVIAAGLWWEGNMLSRTTELFNENVPLLERFPRLVYWKINAQMFFDQPVFGVGQAGLTNAYEAYYAANAVSDKLYIAHNIFLQTAADSGAVGLFGLIAMLVGVFASARRLDQVGGTGSALRLMGIAGIACGLVQNNFRDSEFLFAFWFLTAVLATVSFEGDGPGDEVRPRPRERESLKNLQSPAGGADPAPHLPG